MPNVEVTWLEKMQFVATDSTRHSVVLSSTDEENGTGIKPSDLLPVALGACGAIDVVQILGKMRQQLNGLKVRVEYEQDPDPPWTFRRMHLIYEVRGRDLKRRSVEQAVELAEEKYCSVYATLKGQVELSHAIEIVEE